MAVVNYGSRQAASQMATQAREAWRRFSSGFTPGQKAVTLLALLGLVIGVVVFSRLASAPSYQPLFTGLQPASAAAITAKLKASGVPYRLLAGGSIIEVPAKDVDQERLAMAAAGLPQGGSGAGLSLLDKEGITTSQLTQQADYQRAIQDELAQTIDSIQGVSSSQVEIVMPSQSAFALGNAQKPSASVMVNLSPGFSLGQEQVQAIANLVASAVPDLTANAVTVVDDKGNLLSGPGVQTIPSALLSAAQGYDSALEASLTSMLDQIVGPGNAEVRVLATLNSADTQTVTHGIELGNTGTPVQAPSQTSTSSETFNGTNTAIGGVLGTNTLAAPGTGNSTYTKSSSQTSYETGVVDATSHQPPGQVSRMSVSVVVSSLPPGTSIASIRQAVAAAAGLTKADTLSVVKIPFSQAQARRAAQAAKAAAAAKSKAQLITLAKDLAVALAVAASLFVLWRKARRRPTVIDVPAMSALAPVKEVPTATEELRAVPPVPEEQVASHPEIASRVLQAWLAESGRSGSER